MVSTFNVAVDLDVRINAQVIVKVMMDGSAYNLHVLSGWIVWCRSLAIAERPATVRAR